MVSAWRNFKNIFSRPLFTIIFRPEMLKFHPYSILTGDLKVGFVIFCVLSQGRQENAVPSAAARCWITALWWSYLPKICRGGPVIFVVYSSLAASN